MKGKELLTIRLDADIVASLRATGRGWQTRLNDFLRSWVELWRERGSAAVHVSEIGQWPSGMKAKMLPRPKSLKMFVTEIPYKKRRSHAKGTQ